MIIRSQSQFTKRHAQFTKKQLVVGTIPVEDHVGRKLKNSKGRNDRNDNSLQQQQDYKDKTNALDKTINALQQDYAEVGQ